MKVILATDGSGYSALARVLASKLPLARKAEFTVCGIVPPVGGFGMGLDLMPTVTVGEFMESVRQAQHDVLSKAVAREVEALQAEGIEATGVVKDGEIVHEILAIAKEKGADLIAIGSRGAGAVEAFLLGSVARELVNKSPVSLLVARNRDHESIDSVVTETASKSKLNAVLGYDGSDGSKAALQAMVDQGPNAFADVAAATAYPYAAPTLGFAPEQFAHLFEADHKDAQMFSREAELALEPVSDKAIACVGIGTARQVMEQAADEVNADLLVLGATRHGFIERLFLGSASAEAVAKASRSVWVVRPRSS